MEKNINDYKRDIQKEFMTLNEKKVNLIELRKAYANAFQTANGKDKEKFKTLLTNVDRERNTIKRESDYLRKVKNNLNKTEIFNCQVITQVISYLISVMEGQEYSVFKYDIPFFDDKRKNVIGPINYNFLYLAPSAEGEKSKEELDIKYPYALSAEKFDAKELFKGENYIGIALFKDWDNSDILFSEEPLNTINYERQNTFGYIDSERFAYINDFLNKVISYRAYKDCEFGYPLNEQLTYEELYNLANEFIDEQKGIKKIK